MNEEQGYQEATPIEEVSPSELQTPSAAAAAAVEESHKEVATPKFWGEFESEEQAKAAFGQLRDYATRQFQQEEAMRIQQQQAEEEATRKFLETPIEDRPQTQDEKKILEKYITAVNAKKYDEALLILKRGIEEKTTKDAAILAQAIVKQELEQAVAPHRAKKALLENKDLSDLHQTADHAVWLADNLGRLGIPKKQVAGFLRDFGQAYAAHNFKKSAVSSDWEEPSNSWADMSGKDFDTAADAYWDKQLGLK